MDLGQEELEKIYQKNIKDSKLGEFLWPEIEKMLDCGEIQIDIKNDQTKS